jgi:hypothetical protein
MQETEHLYYVVIVCDHIGITTTVISSRAPDSDPEDERWNDEDLEDTLLRQACQKIEQEYGFDPHGWAIDLNYEYEGSFN